jgi:dephospho-CoA kinase
VFQRLGVPVIDADALAREALSLNSDGLPKVVERFGSGVLTPDGALDRAALGRIVFADDRARRDLEAIVHPEVYRRVREWFANLPGTSPLAIADIPLLFETGHQHDYDKVIVCACEPGEQVRRIVARDRLTEDEARARMAAQWPIADKVARADYVIWTDRGFAETDRQITSLFEQLLAER